MILVLSPSVSILLLITTSVNSALAYTWGAISLLTLFCDLPMKSKAI